MMTPTEIASRIAGLGGADPVDERAALLVVHAPLASAEERKWWLQLRDAPPDFLSNVGLENERTGEKLTPELAVTPQDRFRISLRKNTPPGGLRLFFPSSIMAGGDVEQALATVNRVRVVGMAPAEGFETHLARFEPWAGDEAGGAQPPAAEPLKDPRELARDLTGAAAVPGDLRPWLRRGETSPGGATYTAWLALATRRVFAALADQVTQGGDGSPVFGFTGPPRRSIASTAVKAGDATALAECLQDAGRWVYTNGRDAEARHLLLASEWARTYDPHGDEPLSAVCAQALESARLAYDAYVLAESRQTLDALAQLRKAVVEESHNTRQRAQDLANALWKDLAVASAPFVLKILADAGKASPGIAAGLAFAAAVFLLISFVMQTVLNHQFFENQGDSRRAWQQKLGGMLSRNEIDEISVRPVARSMSLYEWVRLVVGIVYAALIWALIVFGDATLRSRSTPPPPSAPAAADTSVRPVGAGAGQDTGRR